MIKEISIIILGCLIMGFFLWRQDNKKEKQNLYQFFQSSGYKYIETYTNFICFDCKSNSRDLFNKLLKKGVIARSMEIYKMPSHVRVTIGLPEENSIFTEALLSHGAT